MRRFLPATLLLPLAVCLAAQQSPPGSNPAIVPWQSVLEDGTPVRLALVKDISSATAKVGDMVDFEALEEVYVFASGDPGEMLVIPRGAKAKGKVIVAEPKARMAKAGKLEVIIESVFLGDGEIVKLRGAKEAKGTSGAMLASNSAVVIWNVSPWALLTKGNDIAIRHGTEITAYVNGDVKLDLYRFLPQAIAKGPAANNANGTAQETAPATSGPALDISSEPSGAMVYVDGSFYGNTPLAVSLTPGDHSIRLKRVGYKVWEKTVTAPSGTTKLSVDLESNQASPPAKF
jgi:hypothetical protein